MDYFNVFNEEECCTVQESVTDNTLCTHLNTTTVNSDVTCTECGMIVDKVQTYEKEWRHYGSETKSNPARCMARKTILQLMAQKATIDAEIRKRRIHRVNSVTIDANNSIVKYLRNQLERLLSQNAVYLLIDDLLDQIEAYLDIED